jgi:hypothetical protein
VEKRQEGSGWVMNWMKVRTSFEKTLIKNKSNFLIHKEIQMEQLQLITASSYMGKYLCISSYIRKPFLIYDFATAPL